MINLIRANHFTCIANNIQFQICFPRSETTISKVLHYLKIVYFITEINTLHTDSIKKKTLKHLISCFPCSGQAIHQLHSSLPTNLRTKGDSRASTWKEPGPAQPYLRCMCPCKSITHLMFILSGNKIKSAHNFYHALEERRALSFISK